MLLYAILCFTSLVSATAAASRSCTPSGIQQYVDQQQLSTGGSFCQFIDQHLPQDDQSLQNLKPQIDAACACNTGSKRMLMRRSVTSSPAPKSTSKSKPKTTSDTCITATSTVTSKSTSKPKTTTKKTTLKTTSKTSKKSTSHKTTKTAAKTTSRTTSKTTAKSTSKPTAKTTAKTTTKKSTTHKSTATKTTSTAKPTSTVDPDGCPRNNGTTIDAKNSSGISANYTLTCSKGPHTMTEQGMSFFSGIKNVKECTNTCLENVFDDNTPVAVSFFKDIQKAKKISGGSVDSNCWCYLGADTDKWDDISGVDTAILVASPSS